MTPRGRIVVAALVTWVAYACASSRPTAAPKIELGQDRGVASWYGQEFAGRTTANGEIFDPMLMTAAHRTLPFGTLVDVHNPKTNQTVRVRINDRGPYIGNRLIDLSYAAAQQISLIEPGSGEVDINVIKLGAGDREPPVPFSVTIGESTPPPAAVAAVVPAPMPAPQPPPAPMPVTPRPAPAPAIVDRVQVIETPKQPAPLVTKVVPPPPPAPTPAPVSTPVRPPAPAPTPVPTSAAGKFIVQVGAFAQEGNAKALQQRLTAIGQQSYVDHTSLYRVRIGPFATREQAVQARTKLESAGISAIVVTQ